MPTRARPYQRRQYFVNRTIQMPFISTMLLLLLIMGVASLASVYLTLWSVLRVFELFGDQATVALFTTVGLTVTLELLVVAPLVVLVGIRMTHRVAGPLVRINAALDQMAQGRYDVNLKLRQGDLIGELAEHVDRLAAILRRRTR